MQPSKRPAVGFCANTISTTEVDSTFTGPRHFSSGDIPKEQSIVFDVCFYGLQNLFLKGSKAILRNSSLSGPAGLWLNPTKISSAVYEFTSIAMAYMNS